MTITEPIKREVWGNEAERLYLAWRIPEAKNEDADVISVISEVLNNNKCGLIDININLAQKMLGAGTGTYGLSDQGAFLLIGMPKRRPNTRRRARTSPRRNEKSSAKAISTTTLCLQSSTTPNCSSSARSKAMIHVQTTMSMPSSTVSPGPT